MTFDYKFDIYSQNLRDFSYILDPYIASGITRRNNPQIIENEDLQTQINTIDDNYVHDQICSFQNLSYVISVIQQFHIDSPEYQNLVLKSNFLETILKILDNNFNRNEYDSSPTISNQIFEKIILFLYKISNSEEYIPKLLELGVIDVFNSTILNVPEQFRSPYMNIVLILLKSEENIQKFDLSSIELLFDRIDSLLFAKDVMIRKNSCQFLCHFSKYYSILPSNLQASLINIIKELDEIRAYELDSLLSLACFNIIESIESNQLIDIDFFVVFIKHKIHSKDNEAVLYTLNILTTLIFKFNLFSLFIDSFRVESFVKHLYMGSVSTKIAIIRFFTEFI